MIHTWDPKAKVIFHWSSGSSVLKPVKVLLDMGNQLVNVKNDPGIRIPDM
jgi:hypothetical protein